MNNRFLIPNLICLLAFIIFLSTNSVLAQRVPTHQINIGSASAALPTGKKFYASTVLFPVSRLQHIITGYSITNRIAAYGSVQNETLKSKYTYRNGLQDIRLDRKYRSQSYQLMLGYNLIPIKYKVKSQEEGIGKSNSFAIDVRAGMGVHQILSTYTNLDDELARMKINYRTFEGCINTTVVNRATIIKLSNRFIFADYQKIYLTGPILRTDSVLKVLDTFREDSTYFLHVLEFSLQFNIKKFGIITGVMLSHSSNDNAIEYLRDPGLAFIGVSFSF